MTSERLEPLPGDAFGQGCELVNCESGLAGTQAWRYLVRLICANGMVGFDRAAVFTRGPSSRQPALSSLMSLSRALTEPHEAPQLQSGLIWAADTPIGKHWGRLMNYLPTRLEGVATRIALRDITPSSSWDELLNQVTALGRARPLEIRRRYEMLGGLLLRWCLARGRGQPPWQKLRCEECELSERSAESELIETVG